MLLSASIYFLQARPPGIYKGHYLEDLAKRYNGGHMTDIVVPERPSWCLEDDEENEGADPGNQDSNDVTRKGKGKGQKGKRKIGGGQEFQQLVSCTCIDNVADPRPLLPPAECQVHGWCLWCGCCDVSKEGRNPAAVPADPTVGGVGKYSVHHNPIFISLFLRAHFPGAQPVSMDVQNIQLLHQKPYRVSWKADGTRYNGVDS